MGHHFENFEVHASSVLGLHAMFDRHGWHGNHSEDECRSSQSSRTGSGLSCLCSRGFGSSVVSLGVLKSPQVPSSTVEGALTHGRPWNLSPRSTFHLLGLFRSLVKQIMGSKYRALKVRVDLISEGVY